MLYYICYISYALESCFIVVKIEEIRKEYNEKKLRAKLYHKLSNDTNKELFVN